MNAAIAPSAPTTTGPVAVVQKRLPQVNLLPPSVAAEQGLRTVKRWAVLGVAATLLLVVLVFVASALQLAQQRSALATQQARASQLQGEVAQYAEVLWDPYLDAVRAALPANAEVRTLRVTGATPTVSALLPTDPLQQQSLGQIAFTAFSSTIPDSAAWVDGLAAVEGFVDARIQSVTLEEGEAASGYLVTGTVQYDETALSGRFQAAEGEK